MPKRKDSIENHVSEIGKKPLLRDLYKTMRLMQWHVSVFYTLQHLRFRTITFQQLLFPSHFSLSVSSETTIRDTFRLILAAVENGYQQGRLTS